MLLTILITHLLACLSPGPDIFLVIYNSLKSGKRAGILTTLGILCGVALQISAGLAGWLTIISRSEKGSTLAELAGGSFLLYLGASALLSLKSSTGLIAENDTPNSSARSKYSFFVQGFLTNLLNPKAWLYFLSLFSVLLGSLELTDKFIASCLIILVQFAAFASVVFFIHRLGNSERWQQWQRGMEFIMAFLLILIGIAIWTQFLLSIAA